MNLIGTTEIKVVDGVEVAPGPAWHSLYRWVVSQAAEFLAFQTVWKFDTLWEHPLGKGEATCHSSWLYSLCTEDTWKATARVHRVMEDW